MRRNKHSFSTEELVSAVSESLTIAQVLKRLRLAPAGGNYETINRFIRTANVDTSHFRGKGWAKGRTDRPKRPIEDYLSGKARSTSSELRKKLIKAGVFEEKCSSCGLTSWLGGRLPLELDHIDGNRDNNNLPNLRLLCPNCHALTPTYRGKNISKKVRVA